MSPTCRNLVPESIRAEVIAIGDELTSGVRLDTNTQWLSEQLGNLGIPVAFHTTVGDDRNDMTHVFRIAANRADVILVTGGLGPTADDLTRHAIAESAGVELARDEEVLDHIKRMYKRFGREMPPNNEIQSWFPIGSNVIPNPEGTAPGIDFQGTAETPYRIFALPGVPVEMKQMWSQTVEHEIKKQTGIDFVIHHHTIHCFGSGESHIETLLPDIVARGRDPQVGITASSATISLRLSTRGNSVEECKQKMQSTIETIHQCLGDLVYGENGQALEEVVVEHLKIKQQKISILDLGLNGSVGQLISASDGQGDVLLNSSIKNSNSDAKIELPTAAIDLRSSTNSDFALVIGPVDRDETTISKGESFYRVAISDTSGEHEKEVRFSGHSGWREIRAAKEVLNFFRLHLLGKQKQST